jgi:ribosomal protein S18 acetylase RimI-like enzyme
VDLLELTLVDQITPDEWSRLDDRIYEFNAAATGFDDGRLLGVRIRDGAGELVAALQGWTWAGWLEIRAVWVRDDTRRHGLGRRLMAEAEAEARARGCTRALVDTHGFQAPDFYRKLGYAEVATIPDYPPGSAKHIFVKPLG